jgi:hypothetical protein
MVRAIVAKAAWLGLTRQTTRVTLAVATDDMKQRFGGIEGLPTTMLYDRQGVLRAKVIGFEYTDKFEQALKPLL